MQEITKKKNTTKVHQLSDLNATKMKMNTYVIILEYWRETSRR